MDDDEALVELLSDLDARCGERKASLTAALEKSPSVRQQLASLSGGMVAAETAWDALRAMDRVLGLDEIDAPAVVIPGYELGEELGRGGMGVVLRARQLGVNREVAIKLVAAGRLASPRARQRFLAEVHALGRLRHPGIVQVFDSGETAHGELYLTMELLEGGTFAERLAGTPLSPRAAATLVEQLSEAVEHANEQGLLHRDLKPGNVLFDRQGQAKIADFGLAKVLDDDNALTRTGEAPGTPSYMAPEQVNGEPLSRATDVHGLGGILYAALTGRPPFRGASTAEMLLMVREQNPEAPSHIQAGVPRDLEAICLKCLEKRPRDRYASATALAADLRRWLNGEATIARPLSPLGVAWRRALARPLTSALLAFTLIAIISVAVGASLIAAHLNRSLQAVQEREADLKARLYAWDTRQGLDAWTVFTREQNIEMLNRYGPHGEETDLRSFPWHYWNKLCRSADREFVQHEGQVYGLVYSPDSRYLFSGGADGRLCVWDVETGRLTDERKTEHGEVCSLALSADGGQVICGRQDGAVEVWDFAAGIVTSEPDLFVSPSGHEIFVAVSPDGRWIAGAVRDMELAIWSRDDGQRVRFPENHPSHCRTCIFARGGKMLVASAGNSICRLDLELGEWLEEIAVEGSIDSFGVSPDGNWLAAVGGEGRVLRIELDTGQWEELLRQGAETLHEVDFSLDGKYVLTAGEDELLCTWEVETGRLVSQAKAQSGAVWTAAFSPDGETIASCGGDKTVRLFRSADLLGPERVFAADMSATCLAFSPDSKTLIVGGHEDGGVTMWDVATWAASHQMPQNSRPVHHFSVLHDGTIAYFDANPSTSAGQLMRCDSVGVTSVLPIPVSEVPRALMTNGDGSILAVAKAGDCVAYDVERRKEVLRWSFPEPPRYIILSPDGKKALNVGISGKTELITAAGIRELEPIPVPPARDGWGAVSWTADSRSIALAEAEIEIVLREILTGERSAPLLAHKEKIVSLACSRDGRILASGDVGGTVHLWDLGTLELAGTLKAPGSVHALTFAPNSRSLACIVQQEGQARPRAYVWDCGGHASPGTTSTSPKSLVTHPSP